MGICQIEKHKKNRLKFFKELGFLKKRNSDRQRTRVKTIKAKATLKVQRIIVNFMAK